jgi:integrase/recombinase XerD
VGLSSKTVASCWYLADRFLTFRFGDKDLDFGRCTHDIVPFLQRQMGRKTPYWDKTQPTHQRNFFQYLFREGLTAANGHVWLLMGAIAIAEREQIA